MTYLQYITIPAKPEWQTDIDYYIGLIYRAIVWGLLAYFIIRLILSPSDFILLLGIIIGHIIFHFIILTSEFRVYQSIETLHNATDTMRVLSEIVDDQYRTLEKYDLLDKVENTTYEKRNNQIAIHYTKCTDEEEN